IFQTYLEQTKINFVRNYNPLPLQKITTTVGLNIGEVVISGIKLKFWDLGGQEELQSLWDKYYSESHGIIYVIDSADVDRFDESIKAFGKSYFFQDDVFTDMMIRNPALDSVPLLILANKQDLSSAFPVCEVNKIFYDSMRFVGQRECTIRGVCALTGNGLPDGIQWMVDKIKQNAVHRPPNLSEGT
ncbi:ADP-ribosylation factor protein 1, partial [Fasciola gigantica]